MGLHCLLHFASELASENRHRRASASWVTARMGVGRPRVVGHLGKGVGGSVFHAGSLRLLPARSLDPLSCPPVSPLLPTPQGPPPTPSGGRSGLVWSAQRPWVPPEQGGGAGGGWAQWLRRGDRVLRLGSRRIGLLLRSRRGVTHRGL